MEFDVYKQVITFAEFERVLKNDLQHLKESFLESIISANQEKEKLDYSLDEMAAEIKVYDDLLVSVYEYIHYREGKRNGEQKK